MQRQISFILCIMFELGFSCWQAISQPVIITCYIWPSSKMTDQYLQQCQTYQSSCRNAIRDNNVTRVTWHIRNTVTQPTKLRHVSFIVEHFVRLLEYLPRSANYLDAFVLVHFCIRKSIQRDLTDQYSWLFVEINLWKTFRGFIVLKFIFEKWFQPKNLWDNPF